MKTETLKTIAITSIISGGLASIVTFKVTMKVIEKVINERIQQIKQNDYIIDNILFDTREDAEKVLSEMNKILEQYKEVTIADLYTLADIDCDFKDIKYGWLDLTDAKVVREYHGYKILLPKLVSM